jgi:hypothetical protein
MTKPVITGDKYEVNGIRGRGIPPSPAGDLSGPGIVLGSAACVWDDLYALKDLNAGYIAVSDAGVYLHLAGSFTLYRLKHWANLEPEQFEAFKILINRSQSQAINFHTDKPTHHANWIWDFDYSYVRGTSSLFATLVGLALGYNPVILCGVPLDDSPYFYEPQYVKRSNYIAPLDDWINLYDVFAGRVKSMSGRTKELLGGP